MTDLSLNRFHASGTTTQRTAFVPSPPTPGSGPSFGYTWWDTTLQQEFAWDVGSAAWVQIGGGGGSSETEIAMPWECSSNAGGTSLADGNFFGRMIICPRAQTIHSIKFYLATTLSSAANKWIPAVYNDNNGSFGTLNQQGPQVTGLAYGLNKLPLAAGVVVTKGQAIWIGYQYLTNGGNLGSVLSASASSNVGVFASAGALPSPPTGVTYTTRGWGTMWASSDT